MSDTNLTDRCSGHCCERFFLAAHGETLESTLAFIRECGGPEGPTIADMVVMLEPANAKVEGLAGWFFTCKHFDKATRNCGIYETRPQHMCGAYPYGRPCRFEACTWARGRAGTHPPQLRFKEWSPGHRRVHLTVVSEDGRPRRVRHYVEPNGPKLTLDAVPEPGVLCAT